MSSSEEQPEYKPKDAINAGIKGTLSFGGAGLFVSAIQNALQKQNVGAWGVFTRSGGTIATFAAVGGAYEFSSKAAANLRQKDDPYNAAIGGFIAGSVMGMTAGRMTRILGYGGMFAVVLATFDYSGGSLLGYMREPDVDEYERKEQMRKNRRRPIEETLVDVGEGRAVHPPGYEERRRQRLKEKYGIDVKTVSADPDAAAV